MTKQVIGIGLSPNDGTGDDLRTSFDKVNDNFTELYDASNISSNLDFSSNSLVSTNTNGQIILDPSGTGTISHLADTAITGAFSSTGIATFSSDVNIVGNLVVEGTQTQIDTVTLEVSDPLLLINSNESAANASDSGFIIERGTTANVGFIYDESLDEFAVINTTEVGTTAGNVTISTYANLQAANIAGTLTTGAQPNITTLAGLSSFIAGNVQVGGSAITDILTNDNFTISTTGTGTLELVSNTNITGTLSATGAITGTLATVAQPNITSLGTLESLVVDQITIDGLIISSNQTNANIEMDPSGTGDLVLLSGNLELNTANVTTTGNVNGTNLVATGNVTGTIITVAQPNITSVGSLTALTMAGDVAMGANDITSTGSIGGTLSTAAQPNITSVGALNGITSTAAIIGPEIQIVANTISAYNTNGDINLVTAGTGSVVIDQISIKGNNISTNVTNANLELTPTGTGLVSFGTHSALAAETVSGYITILDSTGTSRKVAIVT